MTIAHSVSGILEQHSRLCLNSIDRLYLNLYVPMLQTEQGSAWFGASIAATTSPPRR
jgi:hypothetical protein